MVFTCHSLLEALEEARKNRPPFDYAAELQFGSTLHTFIMNKLKDDLIPGLLKQLENFRLDPIEEEIDTGVTDSSYIFLCDIITGKIGLVAFGISDISLKNVSIPLEEVYVSFNESGMNISWSKISASLEQFSWFYKKQSFPKLKVFLQVSNSKNKMIG